MSPQTSRRAGGYCPNPCVQTPRYSIMLRGQAWESQAQLPHLLGRVPTRLQFSGSVSSSWGLRSLHSGRVGGSISGLAWSSNAIASFLLKHIGPPRPALWSWPGILPANFPTSWHPESPWPALPITPQAQCRHYSPSTNGASLKALYILYTLGDPYSQQTGKGDTLFKRQEDQGPAVGNNSLCTALRGSEESKQTL